MVHNFIYFSIGFATDFVGHQLLGAATRFAGQQAAFELVIPINPPQNDRGFSGRDLIMLGVGFGGTFFTSNSEKMGLFFGGFLLGEAIYELSFRLVGAPFT